MRLEYSPRTYLALRVSPEFNDHGYQIVQRSVRALVCQDSREGSKRQEGKAGLETSVNR